jgi:hypothetical protein
MRIRSGTFSAVVLAMTLAPLPGAATPDETLPVATVAATASVGPPAVSAAPPSFELESAVRVREQWQLGREHVRQGELLIGHESALAREHLERARGLTEQALAADPECSECCAVRFSATGRLASLVSPDRGLRLAREAGELLEQCLSHPPRQVGPASDLSERTRLYLAAAQYFRRLPGSGMIAWMLGERRDPPRAADFAREAWQQAPDAAELRLELGVSLLCLADAEEQEAPRDEAHELLRELAYDERADPVLRVLASDLLVASPRPCDFDQSGSRNAVSLAN